MPLEKQLKNKPKNATGAHNVDATGMPESEALPPPTPDMATFQANIERSLERMVNAAFSKAGKNTDRGRSDKRTPTGSRSPSQGSRGGANRPRSNIPSPKFDGCWCCGEQGHSRKKRPKFLAIKVKNGGTVPKDDERAY